MPSFYNKAKHIAEVNPGNFDDIVFKTNYTTAVEFYAPWCGYCQEFRQEFLKASKVGADYVQFAAVDCNKDYNKELCARYKVDSLPTVLIFRPPKFDPEHPEEAARRKHSSEVYSSERRAGRLLETLRGRIKNYGRRISPAKLPSFADVSGATSNRTLLITDKTTLSPTFKSLSIDFLGKMQLGYLNAGREGARDAVHNAVPELSEDFTVPQLVVFSTVEGPQVYQGNLSSKKEISQFLSQYAEPNEGPTSERGDFVRSVNKGVVKTWRQYQKRKARLAAAAGEKDEL